MSQAGAVKPGELAGDRPHGRHHEEPYLAARREIDLALVLPREGMGATVARGLWLVGVLAVAALVVAAIMGGGNGEGGGGAGVVRHALGAYHMGVVYCVGLALGGLGLQMIFQQVNAGWSAAPRRQAEVIASLFWVVLVLFIPVVVLEVFVFHGNIFRWMNPEHVAGDVIYQKKAGYLNPAFWMVRAGVYFAIWIALGSTLFKLSRRQDQTGDKWLTARARFISSFGLLLFALTTAFASFDWVMSLDYHWFSTMFGVCFFAGNMIAVTALIIVMLTTLRLRGMLGATFTVEHQHDLGKLLFMFTVFWAYVTLSQYFLIWYGNIPEETAFYNIRKDGPFNAFTYILCFGHFAVPFLLLLVRDFKRNARVLRLIALWMLLMYACNLIFLVGPAIHPVVNGNPSLGGLWLDGLGILGPVCIFAGFIVNKAMSVPLVPIKDPRLHEVLAHKNYV